MSISDGKAAPAGPRDDLFPDNPDGSCRLHDVSAPDECKPAARKLAADERLARDRAAFFGTGLGNAATATTPTAGVAAASTNQSSTGRYDFDASLRSPIAGNRSAVHFMRDS